MPHPIVYLGTQDNDQTRSIDFVHIEPSIREGTKLVSSLYGTDASAPLYRFPPQNTFAPYLTGSPQIPNLLTCNSGQWSASPAATLYYQWMADGVDIPDANDQTWLSTVEYDNTVITCEVRGANYLGEDYALSSNSIAISLTEPIEVREVESFWVSGISANKHQTLQDDRLVITTGMAADNRLDVNRGVSYFTTGTSADNRNDINAMNLGFITGLNQDQTLSVLERDYSVAVISRTLGVPLVDGEYQTLPLKNPEAELGIYGWERFGAVWYERDGSGGDVANTGGYSWNGGDDVDPANRNIPYSYIYQDVPVYVPHEVDIDADEVTLNVVWYQYSYSANDQANIRLEFYAANGDLLGLDSGPGLWASPAGIFFRREYDSPIPALTRTVRIYAEFNLQFGANNDAQIDTIQLNIWKGDKPNSRLYGPDFNMWRLRFLQANTWSGGGLSELELRSTPGSMDLTDSITGNGPIFGSAGLGASNADAAFDNQRNTGYWAGGENSISEGTSWIGYDFATPVHPEAIEITARPGSDALQVPKSYIIEGSDDGIRWTPVHNVPESIAGPSYNTGERREILIPVGPIDFWRNHPDIGSVQYVRHLYGSDDMAGKGNVFQCHSRINITHLSVMLQNQVLAFNYRMQLARVSGQKTGSRGFGMISEVLETIDATSPAGSDFFGWHDFALSQPYEFEVGDYFVIRFYDLDVLSNPVDDQEGRTVYVSSWEGPSQYLLRQVAQVISAWNNGSMDLNIGDVNPTGFGESSMWALDFKGNVF